MEFFFFIRFRASELNKNLLIFDHMTAKIYQTLGPC